MIPLLGDAVSAGAKTALRAAKTPEIFASRSANIYNPPLKRPRPFEADYPNGAAADEAGKLTHDIDGRPLGRGIIAGRQVVGGTDVAVSPAQIDAITERLIGTLPQAVAPSALPRRSVGAYVKGFEPDGQIRRDIFFDQNLSPVAQPRVVAHEAGHMLDDLGRTLARQPGMDQTGLKRELGAVYNDLNNPQSYGKPFTPQNNGYAKGEKSDRELAAEGFRAYLSDPNYIKTVAPKTAARIREWVNANPQLKDVIQFNSLAPLGAGVSGIGLFGLRQPEEQSQQY
ncbi:MAG: hypothetical protein KF874_00490 [Rhizobiaceae bacterium]|nr:hypothetical protein [Rhizobiaceae bacterium]